MRRPSTRRAGDGKDTQGAHTVDDYERPADDHAGVPAQDPWVPVYRNTFNVVLPDDLSL